ncbi:hypothetical protein EVG20_g9788 [Dentipellis fragilis]|uniref:Uncharacterized protein n=1 Tax=Dentipellis fragilis TaxID=205917 RepID=A0A4Y9XXU5_9AGAM|nr:hypothetical protein EVG20_g9788 [Dentipellis fragilis]
MAEFLEPVEHTVVPYTRRHSNCCNHHTVMYGCSRNSASMAPSTLRLRGRASSPLPPQLLTTVEPADIHDQAEGPRTVTFQYVIYRVFKQYIGSMTFEVHYDRQSQLIGALRTPTPEFVRD